MSTILFGTSELANIVASSIHVMNLFEVEKLSKLMCEYSRANFAAYCFRYQKYISSDCPTFSRWEEIFEEAVVLLATRKANREKARGMLKLAIYNLDDFTNPMLEGLVDALLERVGIEERCA